MSLILDIYIYVKSLEILKMKFVLYMVLQRNRIYIYIIYYKELIMQL